MALPSNPFTCQWAPGSPLSAVRNAAVLEYTNYLLRSLRSFPGGADPEEGLLSRMGIIWELLFSQWLGRFLLPSTGFKHSNLSERRQHLIFSIIFFYFCLILSFGARDGSQGFTHPKQPRLSTCTLSHLSSILHSHIPLVTGVNSNRDGVVSSCGLGFQVSVMRDGEHVCVCLGHLDTFFGEICTQGLCLLWNWAACFVPCSGSSGPIGQIIWKYTMPFQDYAAFHSMDGALWCPKSLRFHVVQFAYS